MKKVLVGICLLIVLSLITVNSYQYVMVDAECSVPNVSSNYYIVIDDNGYVLFEKNASERRPVASICKLMTSLITLEYIEDGKLSLDDMVVASEYACNVEGSQAFLDAGEQYSIRDLIKSVIVASANDSAIVLAESIAGSEESFVGLMNAKTQELGMNDTLYANSTGLDDKSNQYSTARDTAIILNEISKYQLYRDDCSIWMDKLTHPSGRETELVNTNRLIKYYNFCQTGKTGFTDEAGYCLSSTSLKNNLKLTCVVLGCKTPSDRFADSIALYNFAYANYSSKKIISKGDILEKSIIVNYGKCDTINVSYGSDLYITLKNNIEPNYSLQINLPKEIKAPISKGQTIGSVDVFVNGEKFKTIDIVSDTYVDKQSFKDIVFKIVDRYHSVM